MFSDKNSFEEILERLLNYEPLKNMDKRPGSIIYDSFAPMALELSQGYNALDIMEKQLYILTSSGMALDRLAINNGLTREPATASKRIAKFYDKDGKDIKIPFGSRFGIPVPQSGVTYIYDDITDDGIEIVTCEQLGQKGNDYYGQILPLSTIPLLGKAEIIGTFTVGQDSEKDEELQKRILDRLRYKSYGGNIQDYIEKVSSIEGVGTCKVYAAWQGGGSVLISVVNSQYEPVTDELKQFLKDTIDPEESEGKGVGIAPIGHKVTITTPLYVDLDVSMTLQLDNITVGQVETPIFNAVNAYVVSERLKWGQDRRFLAIYISRIIEACLEVPNVINVRDVKINGLPQDLILMDKELPNEQFLPRLNKVILT